MYRPMSPTARRACAALLGVAALCWTIATAPARADTVTDWNAYASTAIVINAGQPPPAAVLSFAMVQGAVYDAVNAIDRGHRPYLAEPPAGPSDSKDAAAATAAFRVLVGLFPMQESTLQPLYDASLAAVADTPRGAKAAGIAVGTAAAAAMLAARADDGRFGPFTPVIGTTPGVWRPTPPLLAKDPTPWVANVRPFLVPDVEMLRTDAPNALTSRAYARDLNEVKRIGSLHSTTRTPDETDAAIFWQDHVFALWNRVFRTLAASQHLDIADSARLFASTNLAAADAAIGCWNNKYHWNTWRPITAIREAASDGNRATTSRPDMDTAVRSLHAGGHAARARHPSVSRIPLRPQLRGRLDRRNAAVLLRHRQDRLQRIQQQIRDHANLPPTLRRTRREHQRARVGRDPLPDRRHHGRQARREGRALPPQPLLPTRSLIRPDIPTSGEAPATTRRLLPRQRLPAGAGANSH